MRDRTRSYEIVPEYDSIAVESAEDDGVDCAVELGQGVEYHLCRSDEIRRDRMRSDEIG